MRGKRRCCLVTGTNHPDFLRGKEIPSALSPTKQPTTGTAKPLAAQPLTFRENAKLQLRNANRLRLQLQRNRKRFRAQVQQARKGIIRKATRIPVKHGADLATLSYFLDNPIIDVDKIIRGYLRGHGVDASARLTRKVLRDFRAYLRGPFSRLSIEQLPLKGRAETGHRGVIRNPVEIVALGP